MKAVLSKIAGGPQTLVLEEVPDPPFGDREIRVRIKACGVNFPDVLIIEDKYQYKPRRPFSPGAEASGVVESVGAKVTEFRPGDRVMGMLVIGGMAEMAVVEAARWMKMPAGMSFEEAAGLCFTYGTSYHGLVQRGELRAGERLLVLGAAGGIGLAAVEIGRALGAHVIAAVSSREKLALALERGAHEGIVYPPSPDDPKALAAQFKEACGEGGADVIYDPVGGVYAEAAFRAIAWKGRFLVVGFPAGIAKLPLNLPLLKGADVRGVFWDDFTHREPLVNAQNYRELIALYERGLIKPTISARYPLKEAGAAIRHLAERRATGKVIVVVE